IGAHGPYFMNKSLLLSLILVAVVVISGCAYFGSDDTATSPQDKDKKEEKTEIQTACIDDCGRLCPAYLIAHITEDAEATEENTFVCGVEEGCTKVEDNKFKITKSGARVTTKISNIGETSSDTITSILLCKTDITSVRDGEEIEGVTFKDYFTDDDTKNTFSNVNPLQSASDNFVFYNLKFTADTIPNVDIICDVVITSDEFENKQSIELMFVSP